MSAAGLIIQGNPETCKIGTMFPWEHMLRWTAIEEGVKMMVRLAGCSTEGDWYQLYHLVLKLYQF